MPDGIAAVGAPGAIPGQHAGTESALHALSGIGSDGFLRLLVAQLRYQSPLEPADPGDMMLQTAQLAQLDATQQLLSLHQRDFGLQQAVLAAGMVGAQVTATDSNGLAVSGVVDAVRYTATGPVLEVGGREVVLGAVTEVRRAGSTSTPPASPPTESGSPVGATPDPTAPAPSDGADPVTAAPDPAPVDPDAADPDAAGTDTADADLAGPEAAAPDASTPAPGTGSDPGTTDTPTIIPDGDPTA